MRRAAQMISAFGVAALLAGCDAGPTSAPPVDAPKADVPALAPERNPPAEIAPDSPPHAEPPAAIAPTAKAAAAQHLPMPRILAIAAAKVAGEVLEVEFDEGDEDDRPDYEVSILTPNGRIIEVKIDAISGQILDIEED